MRGLTPDRHFYLYAKHHYERTDILEDLRIIAADYVNARTVSKEDTLHLVLNLTFKHIQDSNNPPHKFRKFIGHILPDGRWRIGGSADESTLKAILRSCLSILKFVPVEGLELGEADPQILPLRETNEQAD